MNPFVQWRVEIFKIAFMKKLRTLGGGGMLFAIIQCKIICLPVWYPKIEIRIHRSIILLQVH